MSDNKLPISSQAQARATELESKALKSLISGAKAIVKQNILTPGPHEIKIEKRQAGIYASCQINATKRNIHSWYEKGTLGFHATCTSKPI